MRFAILLLVLLQSACSYSPRNSDEWWYEKMQRDHRSQCNLLPAQVKAQCLERQGGTYEEYLKQQNQQQPPTTPASESKNQ
ncbi:MAG: hypothetical protein KJ556_03295 [Gammaproteobacteria bacterium]|nr:hypothetical protein [Gammaproteobacteria bacterium]MBU2056795.1 hypothetical protein [Gammaproteobacteria bacterium]MBU2174132.1 hypothetical protein [Gammaproteobacteria bacterium]MBU2246962.1 hypothetical protein [Gammaproteobacteria bacterium]MBU2344079.1 hypothetical protein [Gammaproteobacteria bacterium]